jgi:hypothetical protein
MGVPVEQSSARGTMAILLQFSYATTMSSDNESAPDQSRTASRGSAAPKRFSSRWLASEIGQHRTK